MPSVLLSRLADLKGCQLGPSFIVFFAMCCPSGLYTSDIFVGPHLSLSMRVQCSIVYPRSFNSHIIDIRQQRRPYAIVHSNRTMTGKILHQSAVREIQSLVKDTGVALTFEISFGEENTPFHLIFVDFNVDTRITARTCGLSETYQHPTQFPADTQLQLYVSTADASVFKNFWRASRAIRRIENFTYYVNSVKRYDYVEHIEPAIWPNLTANTQKAILLDPFFRQNGILQQLVSDPFQKAKALQPVQWNGGGALVELRARAHRTASDAAETRQRWCDPRHRYINAEFPVFLDDLHSVDYAVRTALTGDGVPKDAITALLVLALTVSPIASISLVAYLHTPDRIVRLLGYVCPTKTGKEPPNAIKLCHALSTDIKVRFGLEVLEDTVFERAARQPHDMYTFMSPL